MAVPSCQFGDLLVTDRAEPVLFFPKAEQPSFPFESGCHVSVKTLFKVAFPHRIIWVGLSLDFHVACDRHAVRLGEIPWMLIHCAGEDPVVSSHGREVFLRFPCIGLSRVSSVDPSPDRLVDLFIYRTESFFAYSMSVVVGPAPNNRVELRYQFSGW